MRKMPFRLRPTYVIAHVRDINLTELKAQGIKGFLFDLDNTIMPPKTGIFPEEIVNWLNVVRKDFKIAVVSNNKNRDYYEKVKEISDFPIYFNAAKPSTKAVKEALTELKITAKQAAIVGDRPLTDIWVGQKLKMTTILVDPLMKHQEHDFIKFLRKLERSFIKQ